MLHTEELPRTWEGLRATAEALLASSPSINAVSWSTLSFGLSSPFGLGAKTSLEARLMGAKTGEASPASRPLPLVEMIAIIGLSLICGQFRAGEQPFGRDRTSPFLIARAAWFEAFTCAQWKALQAECLAKPVRHRL